MATYVSTQPRGLPLHVSKEKCSGKTYIVTGANTGLGFEAAKHLVEADAAKVILAVRNTTAGEEAFAKIVSTTGKENVVEVWALNLASYASVKAFAKRASEQLSRIDAVIENAGVAMSERTFAEGHALNITVNVFSTFLLAVMLFPQLSYTAKTFGVTPHIAIVTSRTGYDAHEDWEAIKDDSIGNMDSEDMVTLKTQETLGNHGKGIKLILTRYPLSKLLVSFAVHHLATLLPVTRTGVVVNAVCPGLCKTDLSRNAPPPLRDFITQQHQQYGRTAEDGSRTLLHGAVAGEESHGCFLDSCTIAEDKVPSWAKDDEGKKDQRQVWEVIVKELEKTAPGCVARIL